jgi:hypothetical protein
MVDVSVLYRYAWGGQPRAMHARLVDGIVTVSEVDPVTCEHTDPVGVFQWVDGSLVGGTLSDTRRQAIEGLLTAALQSWPT